MKVYLIIYESYNRLGKDAVETDAEEIIDMAGKASLADQQKQVQENVHSQITSFCKYMDHILQPDLMVKDKQGTPSSENNSSPRRSGLSFAIGRTAPLKDHSVAKQLAVDQILIPANVSCLSINSFPTYFILFSWKQEKTELTGASSCLLLVSVLLKCCIQVPQINILHIVEPAEHSSVSGQGFSWGQQWSPGAGPAQGVGSGRDNRLPSQLTICGLPRLESTKGGYYLELKLTIKLKTSKHNKTLATKNTTEILVPATSGDHSCHILQLVDIRDEGENLAS
ncbi:hypothetical protein MTR67_051539 [Solanum verrucosum]|uniref:Uncharacterized protein n=1 Tax=Solanum verrucosum TaxID=315347 RepID=A0AAF0V6Q5_SOLVR|nr:hypothetical protein MTR67_051539 [Solanum verrucosum]